jgi:hypothetical protein
MYKVSTHRDISFSGDQVGLFFERHRGTVDVTATDERVTIGVGKDALFNGVKQYISGFQYVGSDDAKEAMQRLQEISKLAQEAHAELVENYGVKVVA